jgi:mgtE-like transporter
MLLVYWAWRLPIKCSWEKLYCIGGGGLEMKIPQRIRDPFETLLSLATSISGEFFYSALLVGVRSYLVSYPVIMALMPIMASKRGALYTTLGSRLSTKLHLGEIRPGFQDPWIKTQYSLIVLSIPLLALFESALLSTLALGYRSIPLIIYTSIGASLFALLILFPSTVYLASKAFTRGWDPDNILSPLIAVIGDATTIPTLVSVVYFYHLFGGGVAYPVLALVFSAYLIPLVLWRRRTGFLVPTDVMSQVLSSTMLALLIESFTGTSLVKYTSSLVAYPSVLASLPALMQASGSISCVFASKISTRLHLGLYNPSYTPSEGFSDFILYSIFLYLPAYSLVGVIGVGGAFFMGLPTTIMTTFKIVFLSGAILLPIILMLSHLLSVVTFKHGWDPDNVTLPLLTALMDLFSVIATVAFLSRI